MIQLTIPYTIIIFTVHEFYLLSPININTIFSSLYFVHLENQLMFFLHYIFSLNFKEKKGVYFTIAVKKSVFEMIPFQTDI